MLACDEAGRLPLDCEMAAAVARALAMAANAAGSAPTEADAAAVELAWVIAVSVLPLSLLKSSGPATRYGQLQPEKLHACNNMEFCCALMIACGMMVGRAVL